MVIGMFFTQTASQVEGVIFNLLNMTHLVLEESPNRIETAKTTGAKHIYKTLRDSSFMHDIATW